MSDIGKSASEFEAVIGIEFANRDLLTEALTHSSFVNEYEGKDRPRDNERLEFLGDAVLDIIVADMLFRRFPRVSEGELTQLRAALVKTESLAQMGASFEIGEYLRIGHGEEISGGRKRLSTLCQAFEAVIGAIYLDQGMQVVVQFVQPSLDNFLEDTLEHRRYIDARSELQERIQARLSMLPDYEVVGEAGPEHEKEFRVAVSLGETIIGFGRGRSKRAAAQDAAVDALRRLTESDLLESIECPPDA